MQILDGRRGTTCGASAKCDGKLFGAKRTNSPLLILEWSGEMKTTTSEIH
jgi:hypothetical protein